MEYAGTLSSKCIGHERNGGLLKVWIDKESLRSQHPDTIDYDPSDSTINPTPQPNNLGDVDIDGDIDIIDALLIAQYYVDLNPQGFNVNNADTNCNGSVNIVDALLVAQFYVDLISGFCL